MISQLIPHSPLARKALILFSVVFLLDALYIAILFGMLEQTTAHLEQENRAKLTLQKVGNLSTVVEVILSDLLFHRISEKNTFDLDKSAYSRMLAEDSFKELPKVTAELMKIAGKDPLVKTELEEIDKTCTKSIPEMAHGLLTQRDILDMQRTLVRMEFEFEQLTTHLQTVERHYERVERDADAQLTEQSGLLLIVGLLSGCLLNVAIVLLIYFSFMSSVTRRLHQISDDITIIAEGKTLPERTYGSDEIDQLALQLRGMSESLEKFRTKEQALFKNTASVICSVNYNGFLETVGPGSTSLWGYSPDELIGRRFDSLASDSARHDHDNGDPYQQIRAVFEDAVDRTIESELVRKDGTRIDVLWKARLSEDESTVVLVAHDVTQRNAALQLIKKQQEEFRSIVERMPISVVTTDESFAITSVNSTTEEMFKKKPTDILARSLNVLITGESASDEKSNLSELMQIAKKQPVELTVWRSETDKLPVELNSRSYTDDKLRNVFLATFRDISVRTEIEQVKNDFVAMISHDLRSPLTALVGTLETMVALREKERDGEQVRDREQERLREKEPVRGQERTGDQEHQRGGQADADDPLDRARSIVVSLVSLVNDFLDLEKFDAGMGVLDSQDMQLEEFIADAIKSSTNARVIVATTQVAASAWIAPTELPRATNTIPSGTISVDLDRMKFAISNFLFVVERFSAPDSELEVSIAVENSAVVIKISADGFKLPAEIKEAWQSQYTFVPALAANSSTSSGLALALSRAIVNAHNGRVGFESEYGKELLRIELMLAG